MREVIDGSPTWSVPHSQFPRAYGTCSSNASPCTCAEVLQQRSKLSRSSGKQQLRALAEAASRPKGSSSQRNSRRKAGPGKEAAIARQTVARQIAAAAAMEGNMQTGALMVAPPVLEVTAPVNQRAAAVTRALPSSLAGRSGVGLLSILYGQKSPPQFRLLQVSLREAV